RHDERAVERRCVGHQKSRSWRRNGEKPRSIAGAHTTARRWLVFTRYVPAANAAFRRTTPSRDTITYSPGMAMVNDPSALIHCPAARRRPRSRKLALRKARARGGQNSPSAWATSQPLLTTSFVAVDC